MSNSAQYWFSMALIILGCLSLAGTVGYVIGRMKGYDKCNAERNESLDTLEATHVS